MLIVLCISIICQVHLLYITLRYLLDIGTILVFSITQTQQYTGYVLRHLGIYKLEDTQ
jgi:hypothetical protein